ncbi:MAG: hypothetical protein FWB78_01005 [Treponema sp.]|nr:hypothetical protein [Treponema sp.]
MTKKLQFGMLAAVLAFSMTVIGCAVGGPEVGGTESVFDFQAWMVAHNAQHPRPDAGGLPLPANTDAEANPSHLGGQRNHGQWPFWSTGNQDIVIEGPVDGRNTFQMAVPGSMTGGATGYGQHGVSFRLSGTSSLNAQVGDTIRIAGYMRGTITAGHALGPGVGLRHYGANSPWDNFHSVRWVTGLSNHPFEIYWVLTQREFESIPGWAGGNPTLTVVREPSQGGVVMIIQRFEVTRIISPNDPPGVRQSPAER